MVIFINGTISSGKSTVARLLARGLKNTAVVEIDELRNFIDWMPLEESISLNLKNALSLINNFVEENLNVIVPYPLSQKNYKYFTDKFSTLNTKMFVFTLSPDESELIKKERGRELSDWEKQRIKHHTEIGLTKPLFGITIDNTKQTPDKTVEDIMKMINNQTSP